MKTSTGAFIFKSRKRINLNIYTKSALSDFDRLLLIGIKTKDIWSDTDKINWNIADTIGLAAYKGLRKKIMAKIRNSSWSSYNPGVHPFIWHKDTSPKTSMLSPSTLIHKHF